MNYKSIALAGVATIALMGTSLAATAHHPRHRQAHSQSAKDAEEEKITAQLNQQQLASPGGATTAAYTGTSATTAANTMSASDRSTASAVPASSAGTTAQTATSSQSGAADTSQDMMPSEQSALAEGTSSKGAQSAQKAGETGTMSPTATMPAATPTNTDTAITSAELKSGTTLSKAEVQPDVIKTAELRTKDGQTIGAISSVNMGAGGKIASVNADVGSYLGVGQRTVMINAASLVYLKDRNVVVAKLTKEELNKLPPAAGQ